ncbi:MAG: carboxypeptidase regulatory-like domain-containing protein, partial [Planctomycetes bacterium]|nr:carboxypeptidase regulatory-like domain-containing protein [Planctomycetota bacterium]
MRKLIRRNKAIDKCIILLQTILIMFIGPPLAHLQIAMAKQPDKHEPDLSITSFADTPDPFSPNGDSIKDSSTLDLTYEIRAKKGLKADEDDKGRLQRGDFFLDTRWQIKNSDDTGIIDLADHHQILPLVVPGEEDNDEPIYFEVTRSLTWNGLDKANNELPDGVYSYEVNGKVIKTKTLTNKGKGQGSNTTEKTLFTTAPVQGTITLDKTKPNITTSSPADQLVTNNPELNISILYSDNLAGLDYDSFKASFGAQDITGEFTLNGNKATATITVSEGKDLVLQTEIADLAGNSNSTQISLTVNLSPPVIQISEPADGSSLDTKTPLITINYSDQLSGIDPSSFQVLINNQDETANFTIGADEATYQVPDASPLPEGENAIQASLDDLAGNSVQDLSTFQVQLIGLPPVTEESGFIDGIVYDSKTNLPLVGVEITLKNGITGTVLTDTQGKFSFPTPDKGIYLIEATKENYHYAQREIFVESTRDAAVDPIYLLPVDVVATVPTRTGGTITNTDGTLILEFPPDTWPADTEVTLSLVTKPSELPSPLPKGVSFVSFFFGEPSGQLSQPVHVKMKNTLGLPAGTQVPIGYWDRENGQWVSNGSGQVSADGQWLEGEWTRFSSGGFSLGYRVSGAQAPGAGGNQSGSPSGACRTSGTSGHSFVGHRFGHLKIDHTLPAYRNLGLPNAFTFTYESSTTDPMELIAQNTTIPATTNQPVSLRVEVSVEGVKQEAYYTAPSSEYETFRMAALVSGQNGRGQPLKSGAYRARLKIDANYGGATYARTETFGGPPVQSLGIPYPYPVPEGREFSRQILINNQSNSPFGAGWSLQGLERLYPNPDGSVLLTEGDGARSLFKTGGIISTVAGTGQAGYSGDGGSAKNALLNRPEHVSADNQGNLYIWDRSNYVVRKVDLETG